MSMDVETRVRRFIEDNFMFRSDAGELAADASLLEAELIDSTGVLELVTFLEQEFGIAVGDAEIVPENLDTVRAIVAYVEGKRLAAAAA